MIDRFLARSRYLTLISAFAFSSVAFAGCSDDSASPGPEEQAPVTGDEDPGTSEDPITQVNQTKVKRQSIGNCWLYATVGWVEAMHTNVAGEELNLSESYLTYWHWYDQIANGGGYSNEVSTGGSWSTAASLMDRYGLMLEADFIPEEAQAESSQRQHDALDAINLSLKSGVLKDAAKRRDRAVVRAEMDKAWRLSAPVVANLDAAFGKKVSQTLTGTQPSKTLGKIVKATDISVAFRDPQNLTATVTKTLKDAIGGGGYYRSGAFAWQEVDFPQQAGSARREFYKRVQRALHDGQPVVISWFVDFNALTPSAQFSKEYLDEKGVGRQGGHMTVIDDYEVKNVPEFGTLAAGVNATEEQKKAALDNDAEVTFLRIKNSWGASRPDRVPASQLAGYYDLMSDYLAGPNKKCEEVNGTSDPNQCTEGGPALWDVVLPPGYLARSFSPTRAPARSSRTKVRVLADRRPCGRKILALNVILGGGVYRRSTAVGCGGLRLCRRSLVASVKRAERFWAALSRGRLSTFWGVVAIGVGKGGCGCSPSRMRLRSLAGISLLGVLSVVACSSDSEEKKGSGKSAEPVAFSEREVPVEVATASLGADALALGITPAELAGAKLGQLRIDDFEGKALVYLSFLAPEAAGDVSNAQAFLAGLPQDEAGLAALPEGPWLVVISGAVTTAMPRSMRSRSPAMLVQIAKAIAIAGGEANVKRIVAAAPTVLFVETTSGTYVSVYNGETATDEEATGLRALATAGERNARSPEGLAFFQDAWEQWMPRVEGEEQGRDEILSSLKGSDGKIDLAKLGAYLESSGAAEGMAALAEDSSFEDVAEAPAPGTQGVDQTKKCWGKGPFKVCRGGVETGYYDNADYDKVTPHLEWPFEHTTNLSCSIPLLGGEKKGFGWEGCGPASFSTLVWRAWQRGALFPLNDCAPWNQEKWNQEVDGGKLISVNANGSKNIDSSAAHKGKVDSIRKLVGPTVSADYMHTCSVDATNAATLPNFWESGANKFFKDQKIDLKAKSNWALSQVAALTRRDDFQQILRSRVKNDAGPSVALINMDFIKFAGHFAPVFAYRVDKNPVGVTIGVDVGVDTYSGANKINMASTKGYLTPEYHSIIDPRNPLPSGVFWVEGSGNPLEGSRCKTEGPKKNGCGHDVYTKGLPLDVECNECTKKVCAKDAYCCRLDSTTAQWDLVCTVDATELCGPKPLATASAR